MKDHIQVSKKLENGKETSRSPPSSIVVSNLSFATPTFQYELKEIATKEQLIRLVEKALLSKSLMADITIKEKFR